MVSHPGKIEFEGRIFETAETEGAFEGGYQRIDPGSGIHLVPADLLGDDTQDPDDEDSVKHRTLHLKMTQNGDEQKSHQRKNHRGGREVAHGDGGGFIGNDDICAQHTDQCDEETDTRGDAVFQICGDAVDDGFPEFEQGHEDENDTFHKYRRECDPESVGFISQLADADGEGKVCVQSHACRETDGIIRPEAHDEGGNGGRDCGGQKDTVGIHDISQNVRIDGQNVGHGEEGGDPGEDLRLHVGTVFLQVEDFLQHARCPFLLARGRGPRLFHTVSL